MAMTLYHVAWCPDCEVVRQKLAELHLEFEHVVVPDFRPMRKVVKEVSGQYYVPVLKDENIVLTETEDILDYLDKTYGQNQIAGS
jgi:mycoredoxin